MVGIPGVIGVKLANPDKTVIGFTGNGAAMYTIQALWSAARHNVDANLASAITVLTAYCR
jgi:thiamine pyrophosphate-dependent acetolactate synthase large subunit-like protein